MRLTSCLVVLIALLRGAAPASAHGINASYTEITLTPSRVEVAHLLTVEELVTHFHIATADQHGLDAFEESIPAIFAFLERHLTVTADGHTVVMDRGSHGPSDSGTFVRFAFSTSLEHQPSTIALTATEAFFDRFSPRHTHFVRLAVEEEFQQSIVTVSRPQSSFSTGYRPMVSQCLRFVKLGIEHIFLGYDHILFLFAIVIVGGRLGQLVKTVSAFTVAHTLTLVLAVLEVVNLPSRLIEGTIALTIAYVAFDNFFVAATAQRWVLTFCFGLVHGFGFASVLREVSMPKSQLFPALVSFNIGVELGQVAIVSVLFPMTLWLARQHFRRAVVLAASGMAFLFGVGWFIQHAFGLAFMPI